MANGNSCVDDHLNEVHTDNETLISISLVLKEWLKNQNHIPHDIDDTLLYHIAAHSKGNTDIACNKLDCYFTGRTLITEFFSNRDPTCEEIERVNKSVLLSFLPGVTHDNCKVLLFALISADPTLFDLTTLFRKYMMYLDAIINFNDGTLEPGQGLYILADAQPLTIGHCVKLMPTVLRKFSFCLSKMYPLRIKGLIYVNANEIMLNIIKTLIMPVMTGKVKNRIHIFGHKYDELHRVVPKEMLPLELEGTATSYRELSGPMDVPRCVLM